MRRNFRRGRPPLCPTTTGRVVASIKPMVGWDTVTDICRDKGRFSGEPSFVFLGAMRVQQSATAVCAAIRKSAVMTQASQWPRRRYAHSSMSTWFGRRTLFLRKRTSESRIAVSALGHKRTHAPQQSMSTRSPRRLPCRLDSVLVELENCNRPQRDRTEVLSFVQMGPKQPQGSPRAGAGGPKNRGLARAY